MNTDPLKDILALDVVKTELEVDSMLLKRSELSDGLELKISEFQSAILLKVREDNKNPDCMSKLIVIFNPDNVYFDFGSYNGKKGIGINLSFASQRDIERANTHPKTKTFSQLNNIDLYDCYAMTSYEFDNNLLEKLSSDVLPLSQFIDVLKYFAVNFETKGDLIQMIKGFYIEYAAHLNEINDVEIAISRMEYQIKLYYKNFYSKEFVDGQYIKTGNVIVVHFKKKDFTTFIYNT